MKYNLIHSIQISTGEPGSLAVTGSITWKGGKGWIVLGGETNSGSSLFINAYAVLTGTIGDNFSSTQILNKSLDDIAVSALFPFDLPPCQITIEGSVSLGDNFSLTRIYVTDSDPR